MTYELEIQKYLRAMSTTHTVAESLCCLQSEYGIKFKQHPKYPELIQFKYDQLASSKFKHLEIVKECRSIILNSEDNWNVVAYPFRRFYNFGESCADTIDWNTARIQEKLDGCCDANTLITTPDGNKTIQELCEQNYNGLVKSYNFKEKKEMWDLVEAVSIKNNNNDWYEIELEDGKKLRLTGNHKVWLPELECWRQVKDLTGEEKLEVF